MTELAGWKTRLFRQACGLGPFKFQNQQYVMLCEQIDYEDFKEEFSVQAGRLAMELQETSIKFIYDKCIQLRAERDTFQRANRLVNNRTWKRARKNVVHLIALLRKYSATGLETHLARSLAMKNAEGTRREATKLIRKLVELQDACNWWERFSKIRTWGEYYRDAVLGMDSYLRRRCTNFNQSERADIISSALTLMHLKESESSRTTKEVYSDAIIRMLKRRRKA